MSVDVDDFLAHHGVVGMKWGKHKAKDPYSSLDKAADAPGSNPDKNVQQAAKQTKREAKAGLKDAKADKLDVSIKDLESQLDSLPPNVKNAYKRAQIKDAHKILSKDRDRLRKDAVAVRNGKLTSNQKRLIIGAAAVTAVVAAGYLATKVDSGEFNSMKMRGEAFFQKKDVFNKKPEFADKNMSPDEVYSKVVKGINPKYKTPGGSINCRRTAFVYEMRRRGLDVVATTSITGTGQSESGLINAINPGQRNLTRKDSIMKMVQNGSGLRGQAKGDKRDNASAQTFSVKQTSAASLMDAFSKQPDGARGEIVFNFGSFGHAMAYEIFGGKPVIFDAQKAKKYNVSEQDISSMFAKWGTAKEAEITRLDNIDLDMNFLSRWATHS